MEKLYEVSGNFKLLFSLDEGKYRDTYEELNAVEDLIRIALEKGHLKVKKIDVRKIQEE